MNKSAAQSTAKMATRRVRLEAIPDGPCGAGSCCKCERYFSSDVFRLNGEIVCGECRFEVIHGYLPSHERGGGSPHGDPRSESNYNGSGGGFGQMHFNADDWRHVQLIEQWIAESQLSLS